MAVAGTNAVTMVEHDGFAVTAKEIDEGDDPVGRCNHLMSIVATDIYTAVECAFTVKRIDALPEAARYLPFDRPEVWCRIGTAPVRRGGITRQAKRNADRGRAAQRRTTQGVQLIKRGNHFR